MNWRYIGISILLFFLSALSSGFLSTNQIAPLSAAESITNASFDVEHTLAVGQRIPINCIDSFSLELIPTLSESVRQQILDKKQRILDSLNQGTRLSELLGNIRGVGTKTTQLIMRYLSDEITSSCIKNPEPSAPKLVHDENLR